jgi:NADPH:quinone reductase-like Zn-dependent oxidoreductase
LTVFGDAGRGEHRRREANDPSYGKSESPFGGNVKAIRFDEYGGPEVLYVADVEPPTAGPGEVRIAVHAAGANPGDGKIRAGYFKDFVPVNFPSGTGVDAAGIVDQVGAGVEGVVVGDRVFGNGRSTWAEQAILTTWAKMPGGLNFDQAAGYPLPAETAIRILSLAQVKPGETLLVNGASGGVGSAVTQIARHRGITVIGIASEPNHGYVRQFGAIPAAYGDGLVDRVSQAAPGAIDAALDIAGSGVLGELIELTGDASRVVSINDFGAEALGATLSVAIGDFPAALGEVADLIRQGKFAIPVARSFPLAAAGEAQESSALGHVAGRTVVTVQES